MVAEALLTARFTDAAREAGRSAEEINAVLASIAERTVLAEFRVTDGDGQVVHHHLALQQAASSLAMSCGSHWSSAALAVPSPSTATRVGLRWGTSM